MSANEDKTAYKQPERVGNAISGIKSYQKLGNIYIPFSLIESH